MWMLELLRARPDRGRRCVEETSGSGTSRNGAGPRPDRPSPRSPSGSFAEARRRARRGPGARTATGEPIPACPPSLCRPDDAALPFDRLIHIATDENLSGFQYRLEMYVPKAKREYGYYVLRSSTGTGSSAGSTRASTGKPASSGARGLRRAGAPEQPVWRSPKPSATSPRGSAPPSSRSVRARRLAPGFALTGAAVKARLPRHLGGAVTSPYARRTRVLTTGRSPQPARRERASPSHLATATCVRVRGV